jgi:prepilin-type N-terminal cleavage/methylation domain-containing protein
VRHRTHLQRTRGFTLLEVVIAIFVIGAMTGMTASMASMFKLTRSARHEELALRIADKELDTLRAAGYDAVPASGSFSDAQLASLPSGSGTLTVSALNDKTKQVDVVVSWAEDASSTRSVSLTTYLTEIGGL